MAVVDEIKSRLDILDVVSQYVQLQRSGRSYKSTCPFHTEKTPSFFVFPERQSWRCFGACATGGDVFSFVMRIENLDFGGVLKSLARQAGVELPERRRGQGGEDPLYSINEAAREIFCNLLMSGERGSGARDYLQSRGLNWETVEKFQLGLSPGDGESLKDQLASKGYTEDHLALAGVVSKGKGGGYRDLFRSRLMFPIRDAEGWLAGFGGRALDGSQPKYLNTPRSPIFDKGNILYAMHLARDSASREGVVVVEGYMDAIAAHQNGFSNVVASMGTALTRQQVSLVRGLFRKPGSAVPGQVILALDPDAAGQEATFRSLESSWNVFQTRAFGRAEGVTLYERREEPLLKVAPITGGKDPAEIILESPGEWAGLVENAVPLMDYLFSALSTRMDLSTPQGKSRLAELLFPLVAATPDSFQQDYYFQRLAALLEVSESTLRASLAQPRMRGGQYRDRAASRPRAQAGQGNTNREEASATPFARLDHDPLEEYCLSLILQDPQLPPPHHGTAGNGDGSGLDMVKSRGSAIGDLRFEYFQRVENREVFTSAMKCSTLDALRETLDEELRGHLEHLLSKGLPPSDRNQRQADLRYCVRRLEQRYLRELNSEEGIRLSQVSPEEREGQEQKLIQLGERLNHIFREQDISPIS